MLRLVWRISKKLGRRYNRFWARLPRFSGAYESSEVKDTSRLEVGPYQMSQDTVEDAKLINFESGSDGRSTLTEHSSDPPDLLIEATMAKIESEAKVTEIFRLVLDRNPDDAALNAFSAALDAGDLDVIDIVRELMGSEEYAVKRRGDSDKIKEARATAIEIFQIIFKREPDESAISAFAAALEVGALTPIDMVRELLGSEEFATGALLAPLVARHVVSVIFRALMAREPDEEALDSYSAALQGGHYSLSDFLHELLNSAEFNIRIKRPEKIVLSKHVIPLELGLLAERLIISRLKLDGCNIEAPSITARNWPIDAQSQMASMLYTLHMFSDLGKNIESTL